MKIAKTHLSHGIEKTVYEAQYDDSAKDLLADKQVLARIAQNRIEEFRDYTIPEIMECIEGEPQISTTLVYPGKRHMDVVTGMNSESKIPNEGELTFDIRFYMVTKRGERIKVIVNIEAQKSYYPGYHFEPRAIVYCARMISEQMDREFTTDNFDGLKKVYSIWIFFDASLQDSDTITEYAIEKIDIYGKPVQGGKYDYLSISFIRLPKGDMQESKNKLIHMLSTLFSEKLDAEQKKRILEQEHQMEMTRELEGGIHSMSNLWEGVKERAQEQGLQQGLQQGLEQGLQQGLQQGLEQGLEQGLQLRLKQLVDKKIQKGDSIEKIAEDLMEEIETIQQIVQELG